MTSVFRILTLTCLVSGLAFAPAMAQESWELCPQPSEALSDVPGQLDQLQADIDRFTLCLNRAELLMKLEDLKSQSGGGSVMSGMTLPGAMTPAPLTPEQTSQLLGADANAAATTSVLATPAAPVDYVIRDIRGVNGDLVARVESPEGLLENVRIGDALGNGSQVTAITVTQVTVSQDGKAKRLEWQ